MESEFLETSETNDAVAKYLEGLGNAVVEVVERTTGPGIWGARDNQVDDAKQLIDHIHDKAMDVVNACLFSSKDKRGIKEAVKQAYEQLDRFMEWAEKYFFPGSNRFNEAIPVIEVMGSYFEYNPRDRSKWSSQRFKRALKVFCLENGYILNPESQLENGRIIKMISGEPTECFYISDPEKFESGKQS